VDDRGVIYLRHGEPDDRARYVGPGDPTRDLTVEPNESWLYRWPSGNRIFHFVARDDVQDYKLVESLADIFGHRAIEWQAAGVLPPLVQDVYDSRASLDPEYRRLALSATAQGTALANERRAGREAVRIGTTTDSYPLRFDASLHARIQLYAVGGPDGGGGALLVFAVPGAGLAGRAGPGGVAYPLAVRVGGRAVRIDTVRVFRSAAPLAPGQLLSGVLEFPLAADTHALRVAVLQPGAGSGDVVDVRDFVVPDFRAGGLVMSDLVLGDRTSGLQWNVRGDTVPLSPRGAYAEGGAVELYYELHGLPAGAPYRARIEVRGRRGGSIFARIGRLFGGGPPVAFTFEGVASGSPHRGRQTVGLAPLEPGEYVLSLRVEDVERNVRQARDVPLRVVGR
jgi:hypothetical protein